MFDEEMEETFRKNYPQYCRGKESLSPYWYLWQAGAKHGYNEALKEVDDICTEEAIYHARLEELFDRINWDGLEVKESEDEKLLKAIKDYAAHGHKDATPFDTALCIEKAIDNAEDNKWHFVKNGDLPKDGEIVLVCRDDMQIWTGNRHSKRENSYFWYIHNLHGVLYKDSDIYAWKEIEPSEIEEE